MHIRKENVALSLATTELKKVQIKNFLETFRILRRQGYVILFEKEFPDEYEVALTPEGVARKKELRLK